MFSFSFIVNFGYSDIFLTFVFSFLFCAFKSVLYVVEIAFTLLQNQTTYCNSK